MNRIQELLGVDIPIIQAPMTYISRAPLAAAVSEAGGLGMIETLTEEGRGDLARVVELTDRPVAANIALAALKDDRLRETVVEAVIASGVRVVSTSSGDPRLLTARLRQAGIRVLHVVGTLRAAQRAEQAGVDGLIVEGIEGGGFKNRRGSATMVLLPLVAAHTELPLIAAGGICDGVSMAAALVLGAEGVQMGTRMLVTRESPVHDSLKQAISAIDDTGTTLLSMPGSPTMRVLRTPVAERLEATPLPGALRRVEQLYVTGDLELSVANAGQVASRFAAGSQIPSVAEVVRQTWTECAEALDVARRRLY